MHCEKGLRPYVFSPPGKQLNVPQPGFSPLYCDTATYVFFFLSPKMAAENGQVRTVDLAPFLEDATSAASAAACAAVAHSLLETGLVVLRDPRVDECGL